MSATEVIERWRAALATCVRTVAHLDDAVVLESCPSTQAACKTIAAGRTGVLVTTLRQTDGQGRLGRAWIDAEGEGVAMTWSVPVEAPERLALRSGVAIADAAQRLGVSDVGIRWPNDIMVGRTRKLAGILIEQHDDVAFVGVGFNVGQTTWPPELVSIAVSLREVGIEVDRLTVLETIIDAISNAWDHVDDALVRRFRELDTLVGTIRAFDVSGGPRLTGRIVDVDPLHGLIVETPDGRQHLPAAFTSLVPE